MNKLAFIVAGIVMTAFTTIARADGGVVLARTIESPFVITIFSQPQITTSAPADITVMVQSTENNQVILDANVQLEFIPPISAVVRSHEMTSDPSCMMHPADHSSSSSEKLIFAATHEHSTNKLLYGVPVVLPAAGDWKLKVHVLSQDSNVTIACGVPVEKSSSRANVILPYIAIPPIAILLFAANQWLKRRRD